MSDCNHDSATLEYERGCPWCRIAELEGREKKTPEQVASEQSVKDWCKRQQNRMASTFGLQMEAQHILQVVYEYERYRAALQEDE